MPLSPDDFAYLQDMLVYARTVGRLVQGKSLDDLLSDEVLKLALERAIEVIGEAARGVSDAGRASHPEIPWRPIMAQRHIIAHEYGEIVHAKLWRVATNHIPPLVEQLEGILTGRED